MKRRRIPIVVVLWVALFSTLLLQLLCGDAAEATMWQLPSVADSQTAEMAQSIWRSPVLRTKIEPALLKQVAEGDPGDQYRFVVELADQADLASLPKRTTRVDRQHQVVADLQTTARESQAGLLALLQAQQASGQVQQVHSFWIFNGLAVEADADTLLTLAAQPEVHLIRQDRWRQWLPPTSMTESASSEFVEDLAWNIARVRAGLVWDTLGLDGSGVTVAVMDTGVDWQHPALRAQYRGYKPGGLVIHQGNWACTTDEGYLYPVDAHGHGTHVAGTAVGRRDGDGRAIGVAPGAYWIAVKMLNDAGYGYDSWIHAAFQWIMAPAGDPTLAPDIVNGSWGSVDSRSEIFRADLQALLAAGTVPVFAAGNEGPSPASLESPGSYPEAITIGATDDLDQVASFSSRGPSPWDEIKPEIVAPGAQIRSSLPGGTYGAYNGTSMATPHVAGLVALLLQADPALTVAEIEGLITSTARPIGERTPNDTAGWGLVDAYGAAAVALDAGYVSGIVRRHIDQQPLATAKVIVFDALGEQQATVAADGTGRYHVALRPGPYHLRFEAFGHSPQVVDEVRVQGSLTATVDAALSALPAGVLWGTVRNAETGGPVGAKISVTGTPAQAASDPQTGHYSLALPTGTYTLQVAVNGYRGHTAPGLEIVAQEDTQYDITLSPAPTLLLVDSGHWYYGSQARYLEQALEAGDHVYDLWEIRDLATDVPVLDDLLPYEVTLWSSPLDAPGLIGAGKTISNYLGAGGNLFLTGQDVGYWDGGWHDWRTEPYYQKQLRAQVETDDAGRDDVVGLPGEILQGLSLPMNGEDSAGNQIFPDSISLVEPRDAAIIGYYAEDGSAALRSSGCQSYRAVYLAAGLEGLGDGAQRAEVLDRALVWLDTPHPAVSVDLYPPYQEQVLVTGGTLTYTLELRNSGQVVDQFNFELSHGAWDTSVWDPGFSQPITQPLTLAACQTQTLGISVDVPSGAGWNTSDTTTLTVGSRTDPGRTARATFRSKTPAPILLVDDHRWHDVQQKYRAALEANQLAYDTWRIFPAPYREAGGPSLERLQRYPVVIWFTAYDWYANLTPTDEGRLAAYLDGGGRLLLSSQDYLSTNGLTDFGNQYLGIANYTHGLTVTQVVGAAGSPVVSGLGPLSLSYPFRNRSDAMRLEAAEPAFWGQHSQPTSLSKADQAWKALFFAFPLEALSAENMATTVGRSVAWLSPLGDSTLDVDRPAAMGGEQLAYTLRIRNSGPRSLNSVYLANPVPLSTTYVPGSLAGPAEYDPGQDRFSWRGALAPGQTITVSYRLQLDNALHNGASVRNVARLEDETGLTIDRVAISGIGTPELGGSLMVASAERARSAQVVTYTLTLRNDGVGPAQAHLVDPIPERTVYFPGTARTNSGQLDYSAGAVSWAGIISVGQAVTITIPVVISPSAAGRYVLNRASLDDGRGELIPLEASTWVDAYIYLPIVRRQP